MDLVGKCPPDADSLDAAAARGFDGRVVLEVMPDQQADAFRQVREWLV